MTYQLYIANIKQTSPDAAITTDGCKSFLFHPDNTDYQQFKADLANGVELKDAEGNPITGSALTTFMETLP